MNVSTNKVQNVIRCVQIKTHFYKWNLHVYHLYKYSICVYVLLSCCTVSIHNRAQWTGAVVRTLSRSSVRQAARVHT